MYIEAVMIIAQVLTNMLFVLIRTLERTKVSVQFGSNDDELSDFVSTVEIQLIMNIFSQHFNICIVWFFIISSPEIEPYLDKGLTRIVLDVQFAMQAV